jgi:hypothetical protein
MSLPAAWQETSVGVNIGGVSPKTPKPQQKQKYY